MRPRRESGVARGGLRLPRRGRSRACPPAVGWWGVSHSLPCRADRSVAVPGAGPLTLSGKVYPERSRREGSSGGWSTHRQPTATFPSTPSPSFSIPACPLPSSPPLSTKTRGRLMCAAYESASVFFSPSPLNAQGSKMRLWRERGTKGERVPRPEAESTHPDQGRRARPESLKGVERRWLKHSQPAITFPPTPYPSSLPFSTKTRGRLMCAAYESASVFFSPLSLKCPRVEDAPVA